MPLETAPSEQTQVKKSLLKRFWWVGVLVVLIVVGAFLVLKAQKDKSQAGKDVDVNQTSSQAKVDLNNPPKFIQHDFVDLSKIYEISKFRSNEGHDFSYGTDETCRSLKHYFSPQLPKDFFKNAGGNGSDIKQKLNSQTPDPATGISIYAPFDGQIVQITPETTPIGEQIYLQPDSNPGFVVRIFHVYKVAGIKEGVKVKSGELIGRINQYQTTDIAVEYGLDNKDKKTNYLSYFQVMTDNVFAAYIKRGAKSRNDFIISKEYRDAHPLQCQAGNDSFTVNYQQTESPPDLLFNEFHLSGYVEQK